MELSPAEQARAEVLALAHPSAILAAALVVRLRADGQRELAEGVAALLQRIDRGLGPHVR
jgi:hypothetical protein